MSTSEAISVLVVEDNLADACYIEEMLPPALYNVKRAASLAEARAVECESIDVILLDLSLPDGHGLQTCLSMVEHAPQIAVIILTGLDNEDMGLAAVKLGAQDYILKREINESTLSRTIRYAIERKGWEKGVLESAIQAKHAEAEAREAAANLKLALKASKTGVWSWDFLTDKMSYDEQVAALFGVEVGIIGVSIEDFYARMHLEDRKIVKLAIQAAIDDKTDYHAEFRAEWPDGATHHLIAKGHVVDDEFGVAVRMAGICRDITDQKEEQERAKRLLVLEQHEDFISTLTHDLKNPLIGADRLFDLFIDGTFGVLETEQRSTLVLLKQSNSDMLGLIQNLLEVYRFDAGALQLDYSRVDIDRLARTCVKQFAAIAKDSSVEFSLNFCEGDHKIPVDVIAIRRVLMNLLGNAVKFTSAGGGIVVSGHRLGKSYILEVEDTGAGIPERELGLLFRRYSQTTVARRCGSGTGLGLYLCRQLVEAHGGEITCSSIEGVGSTFKVILPAVRNIENILSVSGAYEINEILNTITPRRSRSN